jgi:hypothetical protein
MTNPEKTGPEPDYDSSMALVVWSLAGLVFWGVLLLLLLI